uniref:Protein kinase domain-containing protein n=1 Tax=Acrobeloides nanus TaxID=290746 RepID=A0A914EG99_9BILA
MMTPYVVTRYYRAPEVILHTGMYDEKVDVWSIGCIFVGLITHRILFKGENYLDQWTKITDIVGSPDEEFIQRIPQEMPYIVTFVSQQPKKKQIPWKKIVKDSNFPPSKNARLNSASARDLISKMLKLNPDNRQSIEEAIRHPYVNLWFDAKEVISEPMGNYDTSVEERELRIEEWKQLIFDTVKNYEATHDVFERNSSQNQNHVNGNA